MGEAKRFDVIDPSTGETVTSHEGHTDAEAAAIVAASAEAQRGWRRTTFAERAAILKKAAEILREHGRSKAEAPPVAGNVHPIGS